MLTDLESEMIMDLLAGSIGQAAEKKSEETSGNSSATVTAIIIVAAVIVLILLLVYFRYVLHKIQCTHEMQLCQIIPLRFKNKISIQQLNKLS